MQWEQLVTEGHAWGSRLRRVRPYSIGVAAICGIIAIISITATVGAVLNSHPVSVINSNRKSAPIAEVERLMKKGELETIPADIMLPSASVAHELIEEITKDLQDDGQLNIVQAGPARDLFSPDGTLRAAQLSPDVIAFTRLFYTKQNNKSVRWVGFARKFGHGWKLATWRGPTGSKNSPRIFDPPETLQLLVDAANQ